MGKSSYFVAFFAIFAILLQSGAAQTVHVVGDGLGWTIPPNASLSYSNWASGKTFVVGDILEFNFITNQHDVQRVPKASYDVCSDDNDIGDEIEIGPANVTLTAPGEYYYICTIRGHCAAGQKLAITVVPSTTGGASPPIAPGPTAPVTPRAPPPRNLVPTVHVVGDSLGWTIPPNASVSYASWASGKTFVVGDILEFNFVTNQHDVQRVSKASYDACSDDNDIGDEIEFGPANVTLTTPGDHYYICTIDGHCAAGQKLAITVVPPTTGGARPPMASGPAAPTPTATSAPPPLNSGPTVHVVGDALGWTIPPNASLSYENWASGKTFVVGDILEFNFATNQHDVQQVPKASYDVCSDDNDIGDEIDIGPANVTLTTPGEYYYICTIDGHCAAGQKLAITVVSSTNGGTRPPMATGPASPTTPRGPPSPNSASTSVASALLIVVSIGVAFVI